MFDYYYYLLRDCTAFFPTLTDYGKLILKKQPAPPALLLLVFLQGWLYEAAPAATGGQGMPPPRHCPLPQHPLAFPPTPRKTQAFQSRCTTLTLQTQGIKHPPKAQCFILCSGSDAQGCFPTRPQPSPSPRAGCTWRMLEMWAPAASRGSGQQALSRGSGTGSSRPPGVIYSGGHLGSGDNAVPRPSDPAH